MTTLALLMLLAALATAGALALTLVNLRVYARPGRREAGAVEPLISVCIPARNEEANIEACVRSVLGGTHQRVEVLVYDDQSTDDTPRILARLAREDPRVAAAPVAELPEGWNGKQHGCDRLGRFARGDWLLFTDADVRFAPEALSRTLAEAERLGVDLLSTFPRQRLGSLAERAIVPMIFFLLFSYLPMPRMRAHKDRATTAGCGQFLFARREAYLASGGHAAFKASMHDGIMMPRAFRAAGLRTDLFDGTDLAECRMYRGLRQTWRGFAKNAYEGLGSLGLLVFLTALHGLAHLLPPLVLLAWAWGAFSGGGVAWGVDPPAAGLAALAVIIALTQRAVLAVRFRHGAASVVLHPVGVLLMTAIQWHSFVLAKLGRRAWRGRVQPA